MTRRCTGCRAHTPVLRQLMAREGNVPEAVPVANPHDLAAYHRRGFRPLGGRGTAYCWRCTDNLLLQRLATDEDRLRWPLTNLAALGLDVGDAWAPEALVHRAAPYFDKLMAGSIHVMLRDEALGKDLKGWQLVQLMVQSSLMMHHGEVRTWHAGGWYLIYRNRVQAVAGHDRHALHTLTALALARAELAQARTEARS